MPRYINRNFIHYTNKQIQISRNTILPNQSNTILNNNNYLDSASMNWGTTSRRYFYPNRKNPNYNILYILHSKPNNWMFYSRSLVILYILFHGEYVGQRMRLKVLSLSLGPNIITINSVAVSGQDVLTLRRLMSYIYGAPILDVSRSHTTTQHSR